MLADMWWELSPMPPYRRKTDQVYHSSCTDKLRRTGVVAIEAMHRHDSTRSVMARDKSPFVFCDTIEVTDDSVTFRRQL